MWIPMYKFDKRNLTVQNLQDIKNIEKKSFNKEDSLISSLTDEIQKKNNFIIWCEVEDKVTGYIIFTNVKGTGRILKIAVHSDYRRRGIGESLVSECLKRLGSMKVELHVALSREDAFRLYLKMGFTVVKKIDAYYGNRPAYLMERCPG